MPSYISSRHNPTVMLAASLSDKKNRERERLFRFDGKKLFAEACACGVDIRYVFLRENKKDELTLFVNECAKENNIELSECVFVLSEAAFDKICDEKSPEGIITVAKYIDKLRKIATINNMTEVIGWASGAPGGRIMAFESLRDPGNLGTVIRTAAALGIGTLLLSSDCADIYNPRTLRAAMGALFTPHRSDRRSAGGVACARRCGLSHRGCGSFRWRSGGGYALARRARLCGHRQRGTRAFVRCHFRVRYGGDTADGARTGHRIPQRIGGCGDIHVALPLSGIRYQRR